ncbi:MAG TPA: EAL domain-containing protein [Allosphingosinicella sp.]|nr:EAL domain-containing protein [Allosphingosinicella sp.]
MTQSLSHILAEAAGDTPPAEAIDHILEAVRTHLGMDIAFASRFVEGRREFTHINSDRPAPAKPGDSEPQEETYCYKILQGRLPELILDANEHPEAVALPITQALPVGSHLNVPLRLSDGTVYGSFCCLSHVPDRTLTERDLLTMRAFADLAAGQIERQLGEDEEQQQQVVRITQVIEQDRIAMVYQPIHRLGDGRPVGVEALARFPDQTARTPDKWFAEAARIGLGTELELLAVRQAIRGLPFIPVELYVALNVSPTTAVSPEFEKIVAAAPAGRLVVEVTEHSNVDDREVLAAALARLRRHAKIAVDDVGAGYSGLRRILDLRPDILKLDMSLTRDVDSDPARSALARALVTFAEGIGCRIVAEGIETEAEMRALRSLGVCYGQGWHFSRPMPSVAVQQFLLGAGKAAQAPAPPSPAPVRRTA